MAETVNEIYRAYRKGIDAMYEAAVTNTNEDLNAKKDRLHQEAAINMTTIDVALTNWNANG